MSVQTPQATSAGKSTCDLGSRSGSPALDVHQQSDADAEKLPTLRSDRDPVVFAESFAFCQKIDRSSVSLQAPHEIDSVNQALFGLLPRGKREAMCGEF